MSRLYEALTRSGKQADDMTGVAWKALHTDGDAGEPGPEGAPAPSEAVATPASASPGRPVSVGINQRVRLLPHAVDPIIVEAYRRLRTKILQRKEEADFRTLLVTSGNPQEGKTLTVLNLAFSFGMVPSFRVLVVDADIRKKTMADWLGLDPTLPGLSNVIEGAATTDDVIVRSEGLPMDVMLAGHSEIPAAELLNAPALRKELAAVSAKYDLVLVDSPPVQLVTDAQLLATACDAVLLVARGYSTTRKVFEKTVHELNGSRVIGTVLNAGPALLSSYRYYRRGAK